MDVVTYVVTYARCTHFPLYFVSSHYRVKRRCSKLLGYTTLKDVICNKLFNDLISTH